MVACTTSETLTLVVISQRFSNEHEKRKKKKKKKLKKIKRCSHVNQKMWPPIWYCSFSGTKTVQCVIVFFCSCKILQRCWGFYIGKGSYHGYRVHVLHEKNRLYLPQSTDNAAAKWYDCFLCIINYIGFTHFTNPGEASLAPVLPEDGIQVGFTISFATVAHEFWVERMV